MDSLNKLSFLGGLRLDENTQPQLTTEEKKL